jgi:hypothetical protein
MKGSGHNPGISLEGLRKTSKTAGVSDKIRNVHFPNMNLQRYRYIKEVRRKCYKSY